MTVPLCSKCKVDKPVAEFFRRSDRPSGRRSSCKTCDEAARTLGRGARNRKTATTERQRLMNEHVGSSCLFCGYRQRLVCHRKDGQQHKPFKFMRKDELLVEITSDAYVRLCFRCHKSVHWCMSHLGMNWTDIEQRSRA